MLSSARQQRFEALYVEHMLEVLAYCRRRVGAVDAADACSETFLVAWRRLDDIPPPPMTLPYLYGISSKVVSNQLRALRRRSRLHMKLHNLGVAPLPDPDMITLQKARDQEVIEALQKLRPKDREIVMLYTWEDLPRDTIAEMTGMTRAAIDQRIHRAYRRLARTLATSFPPRESTSPPIARERGR
jgi:RNA polymerase sigma factor (sigma-70 family)